MSIAHKVLVGVVAALFAMLALRWMFTPMSIAAEQAMALGSPMALSTARGDVGGMFLGGAILCLMGLVRGEGRWLQAVAVVVGCVALGRLVGMATDGFTREICVAFVLELAIVAVLLLAARQARQARVEGA